MQRLANAFFANAYLLLTLTSLFWAGNSIVGRGVHGHVPPVALSCLRLWVALAILLPFALAPLRRDWPAIVRSLPILTFLALVGVTAFNVLNYVALNYTTALNGMVLQSAGPVMIVLVCFALFGDRLSLPQALGVLVSMGGVLLVITRGDLGALHALSLNLGDLLLFVAVLLWAVYTAYLRKRPPIHWLSFAAATFFIGAVILTPLAAIEHAWGWRLQPTWTTVLAVAYVAIFPSIFSYIFFARGVELIGGGRAGVFQHLVPLFGVVLAIGFLGETLRLYHLAGFALILGGIALAARRGAPARVTGSEAEP